MYTTCCLMVIQPTPYLVCLCQRAKTVRQDSNSWLKYNFHIEVKGQGQTKVMNVRHTLYHGDTLPNILWLCNGRKVVTKKTKPCHQPYKLMSRSHSTSYHDLNVHDTFSHGDRPMCRIWYANIKAEVTGRTLRHD